MSVVWEPESVMLYVFVAIKKELFVCNEALKKRNSQYPMEQTRVTWQLILCWDGVLKKIINVRMKNHFEGSFLSPSLNIRTEVQFLFSLGNKMPRATRKSLRSASEDLHVTSGSFFFPMKTKKKIVFQSLNR